MSSEFDFNGGGEGGGGGHGEESAPEISELALGPEKSNAGRNTAMILMAFAAVGAATIYFMRLKSGPSDAVAAPPPQSKQAGTTITKFLQDGGKSLAEIQDLLASAEKLVKQFKMHEYVVQVPIKNNPFLSKEPEKLNEEQRKEKERQDQLAKEKVAHDKAIKDANIDVQKLRLSFIIGGSKGRTCMINGTAYKVGGVVLGFTIKQIDPDKVIVGKEIPGGPEFTHELKAGK